MEKKRSKRIILALVAVAVILLISAVALSGILTPSPGGTSTSTTTTSKSTSTTSSSTSTTTTTTTSSTSGLLSIIQTQSGLVASDPLTTGNLSAWAVSGFSSSGNPLCTPSENSSGLCIEVQPLSSNEWAGNFAAQNVGDAKVYHAVINAPSAASITNGSFNAGLYVKPELKYGQPPGQTVNYVACGASVSSGGYVWQVVYGIGNLTGASSTHLLNYTYDKPSLTQACTIITNGANLLTVYLGSTLFYSNSSMNLGITSPFSAYLEVGAVNSTKQMLQSQFSDFYASLNDTISVTNAPIGGTVSIVDSSNSTITTASVGSNGVAVIPVTPYQNPPNGYIRVYNSAGKLVASTASNATLWGGDAFTVV